MKVSDVFNPGGFPIYTYNPRNQLELEKQFIDYLESGHKLLSLTGPTKSGKTVLCRRLIPKDSGIWISGGSIREEDDFWASIITQIEAYTDVETEYSTGTSETVVGDVQGGLNIFVAKIESSVTGSETKTKGGSQSFSRKGSPRMVAIHELSNQERPVIIDDFHYIPPSIQINIIRTLKTPIFEGLRLVLISVPHRAYDAVKIESEMVGRVQQLKIPLWSENELIEIANKGFPQLNIASNEPANKVMAAESFGNPQLMQEFCANICKNNTINETLPVPAKIEGVPKEEFFVRIAKTITSKADFELLARGPRARDRQQRSFNDGRSGDIYLSILIALANTGPKTEIQYEEIRAKLRNMLKESVPQRHEISRALVKMEEISVKSQGKPKIIEWDKREAILYILDPYFAFYLRWMIRDKSQQEHL